MFLLLVLILSLVNGVQSDSQEHGSGSSQERRIYLKGHISYNNKDIRDDEIFLDTEPESIRDGDANKKDDSKIVPKADPDMSVPVYNGIVLGMGVLSLTITVILALILLIFVIIVAWKRRKANCQSLDSSGIRIEDLEPVPLPSPAEVTDLPPIEFAFGMDRNFTQRKDKPKVTAERSYVKPKEKPALPPRRDATLSTKWEPIFPPKGEPAGPSKGEPAFPPTNGERSYGERSHGERSYERSYGERPYGERTFSGKKLKTFVPSDEPATSEERQRTERKRNVFVTSDGIETPRTFYDGTLESDLRGYCSIPTPVNTLVRKGEPYKKPPKPRRCHQSNSPNEI